MSIWVGSDIFSDKSVIVANVVASWCVATDHVACVMAASHPAAIVPKHLREVAGSTDLAGTVTVHWFFIVP